MPGTFEPWPDSAHPARGQRVDWCSRLTVLCLRDFVDFFAKRDVLTFVDRHSIRPVSLFKDLAAYAIDFESQLAVLIAEPVDLAAKLGDLRVFRIRASGNGSALFLELLEPLVDFGKRPLTTRQLPDKGVDIDAGLARQRGLVPRKARAPR